MELTSRLSWRQAHLGIYRGGTYASVGWNIDTWGLGGNVEVSLNKWVRRGHVRFRVLPFFVNVEYWATAVQCTCWECNVDELEEEDVPLV